LFGRRRPGGVWEEKGTFVGYLAGPGELFSVIWGYNVARWATEEKHNKGALSVLKDNNHVREES